MRLQLEAQGLNNVAGFRSEAQSISNMVRLRLEAECMGKGYNDGQCSAQINKVHKL
jgi:hypothetical protein